MPLPKRLLALEIRASQLGFAVLEEPVRLLDWGVRSLGDHNGKLRSTVLDRIASLLDFHRPFAIVIRLREYHSARQNRRFHTIIRAVKTETKRNSTKFFVLTVRHVRDHFGPNGGFTKHDIATSLVKRFEALSWKLPERRKSFQSEAAAMLVFDALANGVTLVERKLLSSSGAWRKF
jgi:hypothetical protein